MDAVKDNVLGAPGKYPSVTIGLFIVMAIIIIYMYLQGKKSPTKEKAVAKKKDKKKEEDPQEETVDELIDEIKKKQK